VKRFLAQAVTIWALTLIVLIVQVGPGSADGWMHPHHYRHHVAYAEYGADYGACRTGWWQTLRYGHVRPVWGTWCR
jgi:hypothetical protein